MNEKQFRGGLRDRSKQKLLLTQIESHDTAPGCPDTHFLVIHTNDSGWVELKYEARKPNRIDLRKAQVVWLRRYHHAGGRCYIAVKVSNDMIYLWDGCYALELYRGRDIWSIPHRFFRLKENGWHKFIHFLTTGIYYGNLKTIV